MRYLRNVTALLIWAIPFVYLGVLLNDDQPPDPVSEFVEQFEQFKNPKPRSVHSTVQMQRIIDQLRADVTQAWSKQHSKPNSVD